MDGSHDPTRDDLLLAAEQLIAANGGSNVGLREVARRAGLSHAAPGHVFGGKRGLLTAVATRCFERFGDHVEQRAETVDAGPDQLAIAGVAYVEFAVSNWELFQFMFRHDLIDAADDRYVEAAARAYGALTAAVADAQSTGWCEHDDTDELVHLCWALVHGLAGLSVLRSTDDGEHGPDVEQLIRRQLDSLDRR